MVKAARLVAGVIQIVLSMLGAVAGMVSPVTGITVFAVPSPLAVAVSHGWATQAVPATLSLGMKVGVGILVPFQLLVCLGSTEFHPSGDASDLGTSYTHHSSQPMILYVQIVLACSRSPSGLLLWGMT